MASGFATVAGPGTGLVEAKKSQFLGLVAPAATVAAADAIVAARRKEHYSARHHCTALILGPDADMQRSNDDGEPAGSAGAPMLAVLRHAGVTDVVAVVTRYFGGTLLGVGGLIRAYTDAVTAALAATAVVRYVAARRVVVRVPYGVWGDFDHAVHAWAGRGTVGEAAFGEVAVLPVVVAEDALADFRRFLGAWEGRGVVWEDAGCEWWAE